MSKITKKSEKPRRITFRLLVTAAIISALALSAFAAEQIFGAGDIFRDILNEQLKQTQENVEKYDLDINIQETISQGQIDVVNKLGGDFVMQSYSSEGTTMTLTSAYADQHVIHLYFQVIAPEGTVLPDGIIYDFYDYNHDVDQEGHWYTLKMAEDSPYKKGGHFIDIQPLPDEDPMDNEKEFHVTILAQSGGAMKFNDGISKLYTVTGIYEQVVDVDGTDDDAYVKLAPGNFTFDIGLANDVEIIELDVNGLTYGGEKTRTWTHDSPCTFCDDVLVEGEVDPENGLPLHRETYEYSVTVKSLSISSLSADYACEWTCDDEQRGFDVQFLVVMKDGTSPMDTSGGGMTGENCSEGTVIFTTPIDLDEIDYILIGDPEIGSTHKVYIS